MNSALHEIYIHRSDNPKLVELYEESSQVEQNLRMPYYHFVYHDSRVGIQFITAGGSSEPIAVLSKGFQLRLKQLYNPSIDELCFLISVFKLDCLIKEVDLKIPNPAILDAIIPASVLELTQSTHGYLIYREQGAKLYQLATGFDEIKANEWMAGARLKKKEILDQVHNLKIDGYLSNYINKLFPPNGGLPYLLSKPLQDAQKLFEYLQSN